MEYMNGLGGRDGGMLPTKQLDKRARSPWLLTVRERDLGKTHPTVMDQVVKSEGGKLIYHYNKV